MGSDSNQATSRKGSALHRLPKSEYPSRKHWGIDPHVEKSIRSQGKLISYSGRLRNSRGFEILCQDSTFSLSLVFKSSALCPHLHRTLGPRNKAKDPHPRPQAMVPHPLLRVISLCMDSQQLDINPDISRWQLGSQAWPLSPNQESWSQDNSSENIRSAPNVRHAKRKWWPPPVLKLALLPGWLPLSCACLGCGWAVVWSHSVWTDVRTSSTAVRTADTPSGSSTGCKSKRIYRFQQQNTNQEKKCPSFHLFNLDWHFWIKLCWFDKLVNFLWRFTTSKD